MKLIKTRSGRYISSQHIIGYAIEDQYLEVEGRRRSVFNIIAYLPEPLYPAVLGIYSSHAKAEKYLRQFTDKIVGTDNGIIDIKTEL